jgi:hypothetical protein
LDERREDGRRGLIGQGRKGNGGGDGLCEQMGKKDGQFGEAGIGKFESAPKGMQRKGKERDRK